MEKEKFLEEVGQLTINIEASQSEKHNYFKEVLEGKHPGKKLVEKRIVIEFAEVIDYDKSKLVYEETEADKKANQDYLKSCSVNIDKAALLFANELQKHETFTITEFSLFFRDTEKPAIDDVKIQAVDLSKGEIQNLDELPPELLKKIVKRLNKIVLEENGEEKGTEAKATV